jgi:hypothetical protein
MDSNSFQFRKLIVWILIQNYSFDPQHCSPELTSQLIKSDRIQIILPDAASSGAKSVEVGILWLCPWSFFVPDLSLNFFSSSVCIGIVPASNETSILRLQHQLQNNFSHQLLLHSFPTTYNPSFALVKASNSFAIYNQRFWSGTWLIWVRGSGSGIRNPDPNLGIHGPKSKEFFWRAEGSLRMAGGLSLSLEILLAGLEKYIAFLKNTFNVVLYY